MRMPSTSDTRRAVRKLSWSEIGMISSYTVGGLIHVLLVVALVVLVIRVLQGRRVV